MDDEGYYLYLTCGPANDAGIRACLALAKEGVFAYIFEPKEYLEFYEGANYRSADSEERIFGNEFPRSKKSSFIKMTKWEPLELIRLKKKQ